MPFPILVRSLKFAAQALPPNLEVEQASRWRPIAILQEVRYGTVTPPFRKAGLTAGRTLCWLIAGSLLAAGCQKDDVVAVASDGQPVLASRSDGPGNEAPTLSSNGWLVFADTSAFFAEYDALAVQASAHSIFADSFWLATDGGYPAAYQSMCEVYRATESDANPFFLNVSKEIDLGFRDPVLLTLLDGTHAAVQVGDSVVFYRGPDGDRLIVPTTAAADLDLAMSLAYAVSLEANDLVSMPSSRVLSDFLEKDHKAASTDLRRHSAHERLRLRAGPDDRVHDLQPRTGRQLLRHDRLG